MRKILVVLRREFVERVRNKWFVISTVLGPVLMAAFMFLPIILVGREGKERSVAVLDATSSGFGQRLTENLDGPPSLSAIRIAVPLPDLEVIADSLVDEVGAEVIDGFMIVTDAAVEDGEAEYRGANVSSLTDMAALERVLREAVLTERLSEVGVDPALVAKARIPVELRTLSIRGGRVTEESGQAAFMLAYIMWFILYVAILLYGIQVMGSVVEEKTSRIVEVLVSSLRPFQLLAGKVVGVGAVGLFQLVIWGVTARVLLTQREALAGMLGIDPAAAALFSLPTVPTLTVVIFLTYFLLGYFLYAAMFAAVGAMSSTEAEARQAQIPVTMLLAIPAVMMIAILDQPDGSIALALSLVPFSAPIAMPVRWAATEIPFTELAGSVGILVTTVVAITWIAARIYRVGILMHGKRPGVKDLVRWVRAA